MGDFSGGISEYARIKARYILKAFAELDYAAVNIGEKDLQLGAEFLKACKDEFGTQFVSANVDFQGRYKGLADRYVIEDIGGTKVGITGVTVAPRVPRSSTKAQPWDVLDPRQALRGVLSDLVQKADYVILLSHVGLPESRQIASELDGVDLFISGHNYATTRSPHWVREKAIVQVGNQGKYLGEMTVILKGTNGNVAKPRFKLVALDASLEDDPALAKLVAECSEKVDALVSRPAANKRQNRRFAYKVTDKVCRACHLEEHKNWLSTKHATTFSTLISDNSQTKEECLLCHTTRYGDPLGFESLQATLNLVNVQCIDCHHEKSLDIKRHYLKANAKLSKGSKLTPDFARVTEGVCLRCHTREQSPGFNYLESLKRVAH